ncbi:MAG: MBL fold metallo-hydrolase [Verrucomicrobia bacterium]|nr:MBL fold metallo-hydrolase [Verrucomicrobiota bacterium]
MILHKYPLGPLQTNAILFGCEETKKAAIVDPAPGSFDLLLEEIQEYGLTLDKVLLTHSHWDHIADVHLLQAKTKVPVYIHPLDAKNLEHPGSDGIPLFFPIHGAKADFYFQDGDRLEVGRLKIEVIHTPGHSPGGVCFYIAAQKVLISGDTLFCGSIGNLHLPTASADRMWESLRKLAALPPETRVIPGHGGDTTIGHENWLNRAENIFKE